MTVELRTRKRETRGDGENHHEKLGLKRISCASQLSIPNTAGMSPDPVCNNTDRRSSQPNQASRTPDFSYLLVSSTSVSSSSPISLLLVHNSTIIAKHKVKSSLSISPCHDHELTLKYSILRVQHTPSRALHPVQHTPSTASTQGGVSSYHSHDYESTPECSFSFRCTSDTIDHHQPALHESSKVSHIVTFPPLRVNNPMNRASAPGTPSIDRLQVLVQSRSIIASKCISELAPSWPPSVSPNSLDHSLQVGTLMASKCISPNLLHHGL